MTIKHRVQKTKKERRDKQLAIEQLRLQKLKRTQFGALSHIIVT